jgi:GTP1/Obg family GTP-binding protein
MIFPESFPIFYSISLVVSITVAIFLWRFYSFNKNFFKSFYSTPSIFIFGPRYSGKTSLIKKISNSNINHHPFQDGLNFSNLTIGEKTIQLLELPYYFDNFEDFLKINAIGGIYVFDMSKNSEPIDNQIENFIRIKKIFNNFKILVLANKLDIADEKKLRKLKKLIKDLHTISLIDEKSSKKLHNLLKNFISSVQSSKSS